MAAPIRAFIGGPVNTGKSHLALTGGRTMIFYGDRLGGDNDLQGMEDHGIFVKQIDRSQPRASILDLISGARDKWITEHKLDTIIWDTCTYGQNDQRAASTNHNLNSMTTKKHGEVGNAILDVFNALTKLPVNIIVMTHIKDNAIYAPGKDKEVIGQEWAPDMQKVVYNAIARECSLMGYTWKRYDATQKKNVYGVCFVPEMKTPSGKIMYFRDAKAPNGWGPREPADIQSWQARIQAEADAKRLENIKAIQTRAAAPVVPDDDEPAATQPKPNEEPLP